MEKFMPFLNIASARTSPIIMEASPITMAPRPICASAKPWYWARSPPESATIPFEMASAKTFIVFMFIPCAFAMLWLQPVARTAEPSSVPKNQ